ncbi:hypothetical protein CRI69_13350 [Escherichia sp. E4742]|nr:hypothetical protein CRI69_13350 [Escherichia sp. E4742]
MAHSSLLTIDSSNKPSCVIIFIAERYIGLYTSNNLKINGIGRFSLESSIALKSAVILVWYQREIKKSARRRFLDSE